MDSYDDAKLILTAIKSRVTIDQLLAEFFKDEERRGHLAFCPFHSHHRDTPSFHIRAQGERFHCYACKAEGDAIDFVRQTYKRKLNQRLAFADAVRVLALYLGIEVNDAPETFAIALANVDPRAKTTRIMASEHIPDEIYHLLQTVRCCGSSGAHGFAAYLCERLDSVLACKDIATVLKGFSEISKAARAYLWDAENALEMDAG